MSQKPSILATAWPYLGTSLAFIAAVFATQKTLAHNLRKERFDAYLQFMKTATLGYRVMDEAFRPNPRTDVAERIEAYSNEMERSFALMNLASPNFVRARGKILSLVILDVTRAEGDDETSLKYGGPVKKEINKEEFADRFADFVQVARFDLRHQLLSWVRSIWFALGSIKKFKRVKKVPLSDKA